MVANVLVEISKVDKTFSYNIPNDMIVFIGCRVLVPFGNQVLEGFVLEIVREVDFVVKDIEKLIDTKPILNEELLKIGVHMKEKLLCNLITCYQAMLPSALKANKNNQTNLKKILFLKKVNLNYEPVNLNEKKILDILSTDKSKKDLKLISSYSVDKLLKLGVISQYEKDVYRMNFEDVEVTKSIILNEQQIKIVDEVNFKFKPYLLHGITGSGKTEVYIELIKKVINTNKKAIVLVPEISLTPQFLKRFQTKFGNRIAIFHSKLSSGEKLDEWHKINNDEVDIVIGARSAIFAPFKNIGIIILDEEHSDTYKQESTPFYNAVDIALLRAKYHDCPLILGSATPSLESYTRAKLNVYKLLEMNKRINKVPKIELIDMKEEYKKKNFIFSSKLESLIKDRLEKKEQVIILLNRRGYNTISECNNCGYVHKCPNCDIPYTYHFKKNKMVCHYCNKEEEKIYKCIECNSILKQRGMGTELLEEELIKKFNCRVLRMDYDTTTKKRAHLKMIEDFENQKYDILVGTQMIAKGLDFPNVTLVGIINGDSTLNIPDYKSALKTFQLLYQVAGRTGRSSKEGNVVIQCFNKDHYSIQSVKEYDYIKFFNEEIKLRKILKYPPFYKLVLIKIQYKDESICNIEGDKIACYIKNNCSNVLVLGPTTSLQAKINNVYSYQIIVKFKNKEDVFPSLQYINRKYLNNKVKVSINFNY